MATIREEQGNFHKTLIAEENAKATNQGGIFNDIWNNSNEYNESVADSENRRLREAVLLGGAIDIPALVAESTGNLSSFLQLIEIISNKTQVGQGLTRENLIAQRPITTDFVAKTAAIAPN